MLSLLEIIIGNIQVCHNILIILRLLSEAVLSMQSGNLVIQIAGYLLKVRLFLQAAKRIYFSGN